MRIAFLTSGHLPYDDRIFYHLGMSLKKSGKEVVIISSKSDKEAITDGIIIKYFKGDILSKKDKISRFISLLNELNPEIIICSEPLVVLAARQYSRTTASTTRIIYDVTEWYPSAKNLEGYPQYAKWFIFFKLLLFNAFATRYTQGFIFGEWFKSRPYRLLFPFKPFTFVGYYPDLKYLAYELPLMTDGIVRFSYSGRISISKGFGNFIRVLNQVAEKNEKINIEVKIIGWFGSEKDRSDYEYLLQGLKSNISLTCFNRLDFREYLLQIRDTDIFLDLRSDNIENQYSLPIKLFYYAALGKPVIYSDLKSIRKVNDLKSFGHLVKPSDINLISDIIGNYLADRELYLMHCRNARKISEDLFNWQRIEPLFLNFIETLSTH